MRNLSLFQANLFSLIPAEPWNFYIDEFSKIIVILDKDLKIHVFQYDDIFSIFNAIKVIELDALLYKDLEFIEELNSNKSVKYLLYKNEEESVHIITRSGKHLKILSNEKYEITTLAHSEVLCVEMSPSLEHIVVILADYKVLLLNYEFEPSNSCDLDDGDLTDVKKDNNLCTEASASWRGDSQYFCVLYTINGGRKCLVRDTKLTIFKGPARADNKVVFSVSENPVTSKFFINISRLM